MNDVPPQETSPKATGKRSIGSHLSRIPTPLIFVFSIGLALLFLWRQGSLGDVAEAARDADKKLLILAGVIYLFTLALLALRWHLLIKAIHGTSNLMKAAEAFLTSIVINYAVPVGMAVPSRAALTKRALGLTAAETGAVALWEIGAEFIVLGLFSLVWILISGGDGLDAVNDTVSPLLLLLVVLAGLVAFAGGLITLRKLKPSLWARIRFEGKKIIRLPLEHPRAAANVFAITLVFWLLQFAVFWCLLNAVDVGTSFGLTLGVMSVPIMIGMFSPIPGGAGVREALMIAMAHIYDVDSTNVLLAALVYR
ncbi:MAG: lysylphosphatidylglycerol synthase transmembrane domain-containing protein, partial [Thermomicrobiales bacterium]